MNVNTITVDLSPTSTAVTVNGKIFSFAADHIVYTKKTRKMKDWFDRASQECVLTTFIQYDNNYKYAELELIKLNHYGAIVDQIWDAFKKHSDMHADTVCIIEGYSYSSAAGPLIDLVTFGTLLRSKMDNRSEIVIIAPTSMKLRAAQLTYPPIKKGKKTEYRNNNGVAGGSFSKHDMMMTLIEMNKTDQWIEFLKHHEDALMKLGTMPKPIEDITDAVLMHYIWEDEFHKNNKDFKKTIDSLRKT